MKVELLVNGDNYRNRFEEILDGVEYTFLVYWNNSLKERGFCNSGWCVEIYDTTLYDKKKEDNSSALILGAQKLMPDADVLQGFQIPELPSGNLLCIDTALGEERKVGKEVTIDTFGNGRRFQLWYWSEGELAQDLQNFTE